MANAGIIASILGHCRRHEAGEITATQLESQIEAHAEALEGLSSADRCRFRDFSARFVYAQFDDITPTVMTEFRSWLKMILRENIG
jgi:hypothetical protein